MQWYQLALNKYADFSTRSRRMEYWMFLLMNCVISIVIGIVGAMIGLRWISYVYSIFLFVPSLAVSVRRLHDLDKSGWWLLLFFIPLVNIVMAIIVWMGVAVARGKPDWWGILMIVPVANLIVPLILKL